MSTELYVFMHDAEVPSRDEWQQAIEQAGFPTVLDEAITLRDEAGNCDASYKGQTANFELHLVPADSVLHQYDSIERPVDGRDTCVTFRWSEGDANENGAVLSSAAALTKVIDGICYDPDRDMIYRSDDVVEEFRKKLQA
jgi:hypothetical protein